MAARAAGVAWTIAGVVLASTLVATLSGACALARGGDDAGAKPPPDGITYVVQVPGAG